MSDFPHLIREYVRCSLLEWIAEGSGTTSDYDLRAGMVLTPEAEGDREEFMAHYNEYGCSCCVSPPCCYCTHPGNPVNQEECDECWEPVLKDGAA